jgi:hypothetical protein
MSTRTTPHHPQHYPGLLLACVCERGRLRARRESSGNDIPVLYVVQPHDLDDGLAPMTVEHSEFRSRDVEDADDL